MIIDQKDSWWARLRPSPFVKNKNLLVTLLGALNGEAGPSMKPDLEGSTETVVLRQDLFQNKGFVTLRGFSGDWIVKYVFRS